MLLSLLAAGPARAAAFTVRNTNDAGLDSLREAITNANATPGLDTIVFTIIPSAKTITLASALPPITDPVVIDGTTQGGWVNAPPYAPVIQLNGAGAAGACGRRTCKPAATGARSAGSASTVSPPGPSGSRRRRTTSSPGTSWERTWPARRGSGQQQRHLHRRAASAIPTNDNRIGGTVEADRNLISGNTVDGIQMNGGDGRGHSNNLIDGNYIGVDVTGTVAVGNTNQGVAMFGTSNTNNVIGGTAPGAGNVISGNGGDGVRIPSAGTTGTLVQGNKIGTNAAGTAGIPNGARRPHDTGATSNNTIGGTTAAAANIIAYNNREYHRHDGIRFTTTAGTGNSILGNAIYSNGRLGIDLNRRRRHRERRSRRRRGPEQPPELPGPDLRQADRGNDLGGLRPGRSGGDLPDRVLQEPAGAWIRLAGEGEVFASATTVAHLGGGTRTFDHIFAGAAGDSDHRDGHLVHGRGSVHDVREHVGVQRRGDGDCSDCGRAPVVRGARRRGRGWTFPGRRRPSSGTSASISTERSRQAGPYERITTTLIPGLGSSPIGASLLLRGLGSGRRGAVLLPPGRRRHGVDVDVPRSGLGSGGRHRAATTGRRRWWR